MWVKTWMKTRVKISKPKNRGVDKADTRVSTVEKCRFSITSPQSAVPPKHLRGTAGTSGRRYLSLLAVSSWMTDHQELVTSSLHSSACVKSISDVVHNWIMSDHRFGSNAKAIPGADRSVSRQSTYDEPGVNTSFSWVEPHHVCDPLVLDKVLFSGILLLPSATHLVNLDLFDISWNGHILPEVMATSLSSLTNLE